MSYYHGGVIGLRVGDLVLPPSESASAWCLADVDDEDLRRRMAEVHSRDRVYMSTNLNDAVLWAGCYPQGTRRRGGDVYRVEPVGEVEPDPDYQGDDGASVCAPRARVVGIVKTGVRRPTGRRLQELLR